MQPDTGYPATPSTPVKPGVKTSEFWLTVAVDVAAFAGAIANVLPDRWAAIAGTISTSLYAVSRGVAKHGTS